MTRSERLANAGKSVLYPQAFLYTAVQAAVTQADGKPAEWGQDVPGFAQRFASGYAGRWVGQIAEQGVAYALHEDNRYFASGETGFRRRLTYALSSTFLARHDNGSRTLSVSTISGAAAGSFVTRPWQPPSTSGMDDAAVSLALTFAVRSGINVAREFGPAFVGKILR